jgi:curved DNA-binding protein CbpA
MERDGAFPDLGGRDPYEVLGLTPAATSDEIRSARRTVQMAVHPDRQGDPEESKLVNYAAQILLDESTRRRYDELTQRRAPSATPHQRPGPSAAPPTYTPTPTPPPPPPYTPTPTPPPPPPPGGYPPPRYGPPAPAASGSVPGARRTSTGLIATLVVAGLLVLCIGCYAVLELSTGLHILSR